MNGAIDLVIADDHPLFRRGLTEVLEPEPAFRIVGEANDGDAALALVRRHRPHIALLDISMPRISGLDASIAITREVPETAVVLLTMYRERGVFKRALDAGVKGYILKDSASVEIVSCLHTVASGRAWISPALSSELLEHHTEHSDGRAALARLTAAEQSVLRLIALGYTSPDIAAELGNRVKTIENHRSHICRKLGLSGPQALLRFALEHRSSIESAPAASRAE
ncbi:MAG: response regulator transcription factor [Gemmatimonadetes bacterium]|nr:response regulator transcription factor [Gemmatimonadota bacterium]